MSKFPDFRTKKYNHITIDYEDFDGNIKTYHSIFDPNTNKVLYYDWMPNECYWIDINKALSYNTWPCCRTGVWPSITENEEPLSNEQIEDIYNNFLFHKTEEKNSEASLCFTNLRCMFGRKINRRPA